MAVRAHEFDALSAIAAIKARQISVSDYIRALTFHIEASEPAVQAWRYFEPEQALRERESLYRQFLDAVEPYDAIITPSAPGPAPKGFEITSNPVFCSK